MSKSTDAWLAEARRYAKHIWCYEQLLDDHEDRARINAEAGHDVYEYVIELGERYGLDRADQNWGINQDKPFEKRLVWLEKKP